MSMNTLRYSANDPKDTAVTELDHVLVEHESDLKAANAEPKMQAIRKKLEDAAKDETFNRKEQAAFLRSRLEEIRRKVEERLDDEIRMLNESPAISEQNQATPDDFQELLAKLNKVMDAFRQTEQETI